MHGHMGRPKTPEGELKREILDWLSYQKQCEVFPIATVGIRGRRTTMRIGTPDILICWRGRFVAIETKTAVGRLTKEQAQILEAIRKNGLGVAIVARSIEDVQKALFALEAT